MSDKAIEEWTTRLLALSSNLDQSRARAFVEEIYATARRDLDEERSEADYERDE